MIKKKKKNVKCRQFVLESQKKKKNSNYIESPKINYKTKRDPKMKLKGIRRIERKLWY